MMQNVGNRFTTATGLPPLFFTISFELRDIFSFRACKLQPVILCFVKTQTKLGFERKWDKLISEHVLKSF